ncbi:unnamed protein product [Closterium sp. NIES-54]
MHLSTCSHAWLRNARAKGQARQLQLVRQQARQQHQVRHQQQEEERQHQQRERLQEQQQQQQQQRQPQPSLSSHAPSAPRRLRYRSRQRGFLELDLLLGKWVEQHLPALDPPRLTALARLMDEESPDLFKWFTGQEQAPEHVVQNPVYLSIRSKVDERLHRMHPAVRAAPGLPWVRGWEDMQRQPGTPPAGNQ